MRKIIIFILILQIVMVYFANTARALDINLEKERLVSDQTKFTFGLGWAGNEFLGGVTKDGLDNPKLAYGLNNWLGFSYTWIFGAPPKENIIAAIDEVVRENGGAEKLRDYDLKILTKRKLNIGSYTYFRIGTVYLVLPLIMQYGWMMPLSDFGRFQFGVGLPLLLNLGINFDF